MIEIDQLSKTFKRGAQEIVAIDNLSLQIPTGQRLAILGKSGSGKSTLLNLLGGLDRPSSGTLSIDGRRLDKMSKNELADYRCQKIGIIFQSFQLLPHLTAIENVELPMTIDGKPPAVRRKRATELLDLVELTHRKSHLPTKLSGGEQQRVALARALVNQPSLVLADEPTGNLDSATAETVERLILDVCNSVETTFALVTHDDSLARRFAERTIHLRDGKIVETGSSPKAEA